MLTSRLIRRRDADLHFGALAYLIRNFGSPPRPPVPSPLHKSEPLETLAWSDSDTRSVYDWAEDNLGVIQSLCHMEKFDFRLEAAGDGLNANKFAAFNRLQSLASGRTPYHKPGAYNVLYDPRDASDPGHFVATIILQLAERRIADYEADQNLSELMRRLLTLTAAVYNRQGFVLARLPRSVSDYLTSDRDSRAVPQRIVENNLCFATCLALRVRHQSPEQIIATYGVRMNKSFRRKIRQACRQIDSNSETLEVLQMLASPKAEQLPGSLRRQRSA